MTATDGGYVEDDPEREMNRIRLNAYKRYERFADMVLNPVQTIVERPLTILYVTVPITLVVFVIRAWPMIETGAPDIRVLDDLLIQSMLFLVGTFAVAQEIYTRRIRSIEAAVPDLLERLASTNEAGATFTESLRRVDRSDLGALDTEVSRLLNDVNWGARTEKALQRFSDRIGSSTIARVVALITNAMTASGNVGPVIRIAAEEAREDRRLKTKRRQEMLMYVIIIYLSFLVFLGIAIALQTVLIPAIPSAEDLGGVAASGPVSVDLPIDPVQGEEKDAYTLVLYHGAMVQALCSGLVAGQMGEGSVLDGAKHVTVMMGMGYVLFLFFA